MNIQKFYSDLIESDVSVNVVRNTGTYSRNNDSAFIFVFAALTGLRQGEMLALTHNDVDLTANVITVNKSVNHLTVDGQYKAVLSTTKTTGSTRDVPLLDALRPMLKAHIHAERLKLFRLGVPVNGSTILFSSETGGYIEGKNLRTRFKRLLNRLDIEPVTVHSLRHYFCTVLAENGVNVKTASVLMGHSDINTTMKIYTHVQQEEKKRGIATLSNVFI